MLLDNRQAPNYTNMRDMLDDDIFDDDIVEITMEDVEEQVSDDASIAESEPKDDTEIEMEPPKDDSIAKFTEHSGSVFCCAFHPSGDHAVTGGEDDKAIVWDLNSNKLLMEFSKFKDSVCEVGFSWDGKYIAAADMMGHVVVRRLESSTAEIVWSDKIEDVQWMEWHKHAHVLMAGGIGVNVYIWKIPTGECKVLCGESRSTVGSFLPDGKKALVAHNSGSVKLYNLVNCETLWQIKQKDWHVQEVVSLAIHPNGSLAVVGDVRGNVAFFTLQNTPKIVKEFSFAEQTPVEDSKGYWCIENLIFINDPSVTNLVVSTSSSMFIWDYAKQCLRHRLVFECGLTKMISVEGTATVAAGTSEGDVFLIDTNTATISHKLLGHTNIVLSLAISKDKKKLISTSDDGTARLFSLEGLL